MTVIALLPSWLVLTYVGVVGACVGSFLNVVIARLPAGESLLRPRSRCPACRTSIRWYDNVPILSWLVLRGRCRACGASISARYPLVEGLMCALALAIYLRFGFGWQLLLWGPLIAASLALVFLDIDHYWIPDVISMPLLAWAGLGSLLPGSVGPMSAAWGLGPAIGLWVFAWLFERVMHREGMGFGDIKLLAVLGLALGPLPTIIVLLLASLQGSIVGVIVLAVGGHRPPGSAPSGETVAAQSDASEEPWVPHKRAVPFGPFLIVACYQVVLLPSVFLDVPLELLSLKGFIS